MQGAAARAVALATKPFAVTAAESTMCARRRSLPNAREVGFSQGVSSGGRRIGRDVELFMLNERLYRDIENVAFFTGDIHTFHVRSCEPRVEVE